MIKSKKQVVVKTTKKRGRPRKIRTAEELAKLNQPKLTLAEKQAIKLKQQKERQLAKGNEEPANKDRFYCTNKELMTELVKWRDSAKRVEDRTPSEELGKMIMAVGNKMLNRSEFRNYPQELKQDMCSFYYYKLIKGLKNYNFEFNNPFAFFSQCAWNSFLTIIAKHYKQQNIKKDLIYKLAQELETYTGISPTSGLSKCIKAYLGNDVEIN